MIWLVASGLALIVGFAISRGGICAVAGVRQLVETGRTQLFISFLECAAWALVALLAANALGLMSITGWPSRMLVSGALAGGALFGLGALLNGACAFGTIARIGSGDISFMALIPGFLIGVLVLHWIGAVALAPASMETQIAGALLAPLVVVLVVFVLWRLWSALRFAQASGNLRRLAAEAWPPALAVTLIALVNVALLVLVFSWPYTSVLTDIANGRAVDLFGRSMLALALLAGAVAGAVSAGLYHFRTPTPESIARRFGGGVLMGAGAAMIPGGNDSLVLIGLPLLQPSAAAAYLAMIGAISIGVAARRIWMRKQPARASE